MSDSKQEFVILAFEASADQASVAVLTSGGAMSIEVHSARHGHAAIITELATAALTKAGVTAKDITHVAAGRGPGSFTGIRVALAAAKGFYIAAGGSSFAGKNGVEETQVLGMGFSCLEAAAFVVRRTLDQDAMQFSDDSFRARAIIATADTRRGSFFAQIFSADYCPQDGVTDTDRIIEIDVDSQPRDFFLPESWKGAVIIGPGADVMTRALPELELYPMSDTPAIDAAQIAALAADRLNIGGGFDALVPLYVAPVFLGPPKVNQS
ncbi:tRNA (adenosine(37)-N6)-threonylcarbamoyltransferase complex dimerization subunit type 1 TsaB [SAR116 cluster bacterium]|nr:tRNA (adenosine(37)-N6)-threonylcarbamoyltransferase complex dimerization subunit type 1 TsaB [SAR116 cluster bacterium]